MNQIKKKLFSAEMSSTTATKVEEKKHQRASRYSHLKLSEKDCQLTNTGLQDKSGAQFLRSLKEFDIKGCKDIIRNKLVASSGNDSGRVTSGMPSTGCGAMPELDGEGSKTEQIARWLEDRRMKRASDQLRPTRKDCKRTDTKPQAKDCAQALRSLKELDIVKSCKDIVRNKLTTLSENDSDQGAPRMPSMECDTMPELDGEGSQTEQVNRWLKDREMRRAAGQSARSGSVSRSSRARDCGGKA